MATSVFVSYAWGEDFAVKEWLRDRVLLELNALHSVFWDRDSIKPGEDTFEAIKQFLSRRPLDVLCFVDSAYLAAAKKRTSGLTGELRLLKQLRNTQDVRVIPLLLEEGLAGQLPSALRGLVYVDLSELHKHGLSLGFVLLELVGGATQAQLLAQIRDWMESWALRSRLRRYLASHMKGAFKGHPLTREVIYDNHELVVAPRWMYEDITWQPTASEKQRRYFYPAKGQWHWDDWTPSLGMRTLAAAITDKCFSGAAERGLTSELEIIGNVLTSNNISMTKRTEVLLVTPLDMEQACMHNVRTMKITKALLDALSA